MTELRRTHLGDVRGDFAAIDRAALAFFTACLEPPSASTPTPDDTMGESR